MSASNRFTVKLQQQQDFQFLIDFGAFGDFYTDEPEPLGQGEGPNPTHMLAAAAANCLSASLLFALRKYKEDPGLLRAEVTGELERNENNRWRVGKLDVSVKMQAHAAALPHLESVLKQFEDFCVVTQSIREGVVVKVTIADGSGAVVHQHEA